MITDVEIIFFWDSNENIVEVHIVGMILLMTELKFIVYKKSE